MDHQRMLLLIPEFPRALFDLRRRIPVEEQLPPMRRHVLVHHRGASHTKHVRQYHELRIAAACSARCRSSRATSTSARDACDAEIRTSPKKSAETCATQLGVLLCAYAETRRSEALESLYRRKMVRKRMQ